MPTLHSKEENEQAVAAKQKFAKKTLLVSAFLSVTQHVIILQSEPMLVKELAGGDLGLAASLLANSLSLSSALAIVVNQVGGKLSDTFGRKPFLLLGPAANILFGLFVYNNSARREIVLPLRVLRFVLTAFSSTVMVSTCIQDVCKGPEIGVAMTEMGAVTGFAIVLAPFMETYALQLSRAKPRFTYLALSALGLVHTAFGALVTPETLPAAQRKSISDALSMSTFNPFGFLNIFKRGSAALQKLMLITTFQTFLEGRNLSDLVEIWKREHLKWSIEGSRNFVVVYGLLCTIAGAKVTTYLLKALSARGFTSLTNFTNLLGFVLRGSVEKSWMFLLAVVPMLPGVNGTSASALRALTSEMAAAEHFGKGEFSAWTNNLRALASVAASALNGNYYAWCKRSGVYAGTTFMLAGLVGALIPQVLLHFVRDSELSRPADKGKSEGRGRHA